MDTLSLVIKKFLMLTKKQEAISAFVLPTQDTNNSLQIMKTNEYESGALCINLC